jgi:hypothetical protein
LRRATTPASISISLKQNLVGCTLHRVIPWLIFAVVVVPLVVVAFVVARRNTAAGEHPALEDDAARARTEQEFADAEAYEAKWHEADKERYHEERLP